MVQKKSDSCDLALIQNSTSARVQSKNISLNGKLSNLDLYPSPSVLPNAEIPLKTILLRETEAFLSPLANFAAVSL